MLQIGGRPVAEPLQDDRDQRQDDKAADRKKDVWLEEGGAVGRAAARQDRAEARPNANKNDLSCNDPDEGADDEDGRADPEERRRQIDEPEGEQRHQTKHQHVAELVLTKAGFELPQRGAGAGPEDIAKDGPRRQEEHRRAERRPDHVEEAASQRSEEESAQCRQQEAGGKRKRGAQGVDEDEDERRCIAEVLHPLVQPFPVACELREAEIIERSGHVQKNGDRSDDAGDCRQPERQGLRSRWRKRYLVSAAGPVLGREAGNGHVRDPLASVETVCWRWVGEARCAPDGQPCSAFGDAPVFRRASAAPKIRARPRPKIRWKPTYTVTAWAWRPSAKGAPFSGSMTSQRPRSAATPKMSPPARRATRGVRRCSSSA